MKLESIPENTVPEFKEAFIDRYSKLTNWDEFKKYSTSWLTRAIRVNTLKSSVEEIKERLKEWNLTPVPWCKEGFWIEHKGGRRDVGNLIEHQLGYIYIQEAASMIPPIVLDPKPGESILDICAAPGSKTTQIAAMMNNEGIIVANEVNGLRIKPLGMNIQRSGLTCTIISHMRAQQIKNMQFDRVLVDAPCSGTGTIRKSLRTIKIWNPNMTKKISSLQKQILRSAWRLVKPGGVLVYSTCTLEPEENEENVSWLLEENEDAKTEPIKLNIKHDGPIMEFEGKKYHEGVKNCLRIWPQDNNTEGFFIAKLRKND